MKAERSPSPELATLRSVLKLEERRGYDDHAVVRGLAEFVARMAPDLGFGSDVAAMLRGYATLDPAQRAELVARMLRQIDQTEIGLVLSSPGDSPSNSASINEVSGSEASEDKGSAGKAPAPRPRPQVKASGILREDMPVERLPGVGAARAASLGKLGLFTVGDLRLHLPLRYLDYPPPQRASELGFRHLASFEGVVRNVEVAPLPGRRYRTTVFLGDETGTIAAVWIRAGAPFTAIKPGQQVALSGPLVSYGRQVYFDNPDFEPAYLPPTSTRRIVPVYPLAAGLFQPFVRSLVKRAVESLPPLEEWLPDPIRDEAQLMDRQGSIEELHAPATMASLESARRRFAFDELLPLMLVIFRKRMQQHEMAGIPIEAPWGLLAAVRRDLPFSLTRAQQRVLSAVLADLAQPRPMVRLLQGEVGSGKTVVAAMALLAAMATGGQGAIMAPTEILAEQHFRTLTRLFGSAQPSVEAALGHPLRLGMLSGSLSKAARAKMISAISRGEVDVAVGTHALIQQDVEFPNLRLVVVDEQHRFGVRQRVAAREKGEAPHLLVMTATPIPRTLALTLYGDLDISLIDELPPGRKPVETVLLGALARDAAYERVREEVSQGFQAYVICPLVEGSPTMEVRAATTEYERLQQGELAGLRLALLHGRMRATEKDRVMRAFSDGEVDVLVSTSVVEVGVDVPNASVMVIEGAERFGMAQLHQFRGRVGRGSQPSVCFLMAGVESPDTLERLEAVARCSNGLELAEEDLRIRGPGDYFGLRQSGLPELRVASISDLDLVERVRSMARRILDQDPGLRLPEHALLARAVASAEQTAAAEAN